MTPNETFPLKNKRLWVTGGNGFLGKHVVAELQRRGAEVLAPRSTEVDLLDPSVARAFMEQHKPDGVIHMAARVGGIGANREHPGDFIEACRLEQVEKLMVLGTVCAYPKFCPTPFHEDELWNGYPEETNAPYGVAKKALLVQLQAYRQQYGTRGIFLIPVNLYGPGDHLDLASNHVIPALIRKFIEAKREGRDHVELWGTGTVSREFLFVEDAARGIAEGMAGYEDGDPVNLGTGEEVTIKDLALKIKAITGFEGELRFNPAYPDGQPKRQLDTSRALERFGWQAQVRLDEGLRATTEWMRGVL